MTDELQLPPFPEWCGPASLHWLQIIAYVGIAGIIVGYFVAALRHGPLAAFRVTGQVLIRAVEDLVRISPRRIWALSWLAVKEAIRRRVVVGFLVFIVVLLFAGWFLDPSSPEPARLYISFVLTATSYLVLLLVLFLSAFSLPADIRSRTVYTVVTKPVRHSEIVLGRVLGFTAMGTGLLVVMGLISYFFVVRGLSHTHTLRQEDAQRLETAWTKQQADGKPAPLQVLHTNSVYGHQHRVEIDLAGKEASFQTQLNLEQGHWHELSGELVPDKSSVKLKYEVGSPEGALVARVPIRGKKLRFRDREGLDAKEGINVGDEWTYRSYIQGGSQAAAIWEFAGLRSEDFGDEVPVEMSLGVFRTHKGNIEKGVLGSLSVRNPDNGLTVEVEIFESKEFRINRLVIPRKITKFSSAQMIPQRTRTAHGVEMSPAPEKMDPKLAEKKEFDLFEDLVSDGKVELWLRCLEPGQYFGAAQPDLYVRADDASFKLNFVKGYFGIWTQMVLVIAFGVMFSTFLSGPVAMLATLGIVMAGLFSSFMVELAYGKTYGGGPVESVIRLFTQQNVMTEMDPGLTTTVAKMTDYVLLHFLQAVAAIVPAFGNFSYADWVADGFNVSTDLILIHSLMVVGFVIPLVVAGYLFLKTREVAR
jgi:hypothetical protein